MACALCMSLQGHVLTKLDCRRNAACFQAQVILLPAVPRPGAVGLPGSPNATQAA
jgi:hypothetical protein